MKKYIFAAVFILLVLLVLFTDNKAEAHTEPPKTTVTSTAAATQPPQTVTVTSAVTDVPATGTVTAEDYGSSIVKTAEGLIGIDFSEGGDEPSEGFDNSGFIYYVLRENGYVNCPRQISGQVEWGPTVDIDGIEAGDVLYFSDEPGQAASFGGIYAGNGIMIYSPYPGEKVKTTDITPEYWQSRFVTALSL